jgi:HSP20 family protein
MNRYAFFSPVFRPTAFDLLREAFQPVTEPTQPEPVYSARIQVTETDTAYRISAELPGAVKEDIEVSIDGAQVAIAAVLKAAPLAEGERVLRREFGEGRIGRTITLNAEIDESQASAKFENGVLQLVLPKKTQPAAKRLAIH